MTPNYQRRLDLEFSGVRQIASVQLQQQVATKAIPSTGFLAYFNTLQDWNLVSVVKFTLLNCFNYCAWLLLGVSEPSSNGFEGLTTSTSTAHQQDGWLLIDLGANKKCYATIDIKSHGYQTESRSPWARNGRWHWSHSWKCKKQQQESTTLVCNENVYLSPTNGTDTHLTPLVVKSCFGALGHRLVVDINSGFDELTRTQSLSHSECQNQNTLKTKKHR